MLCGDKITGLLESFDCLVYPELLVGRRRCDTDTDHLRNVRSGLFDTNSVHIGRINGKQAPTIPKADSTMGQYSVGVSKSIPISELESSLNTSLGRYVHVTSEAPAAIARNKTD